MKTKKKPIYSCDVWGILEENFIPEYMQRSESVFTLGNGYLGMRGCFEEGTKECTYPSVDGTYINGFYETEMIKYGEVAYGFAEKSQTILNVSNGKKIRLFINDEAFSMFTGKVLEYKRTLSMKQGVLKREVLWQSEQGAKVKIVIQRFVSYYNKNLAVVHYEVTPLEGCNSVRIVSELDGDVTNVTTQNDPRVGCGLQGRSLQMFHGELFSNGGMIAQYTDNSKLAIASAIINHIDTSDSYVEKKMQSEFGLATEFCFEKLSGKKIVLDKYIAYDTGRLEDVQTLIKNVTRVTKQAQISGYTKELECHQACLAEFWEKANVEIDGDDELLQGIRFNMFQLYQSVGKDGKTNISAKGLTGEGYEGHYFWDTETYILPFFSSCFPEIARKLLEYRYSILDRARNRAREMSHPKGALYPWRTINGDECSAYYEAGSAQYHINADIAHAVKTYVEQNNDKQFMLNYGVEMLVETARLWYDLGFFNSNKGGQFCINEVTGPDEYNALVNNNCYTNMMARENLNSAYEAVKMMKDKHLEGYNRLVDKIDLDESELGNWKDAADKMYIPYDTSKKLYLQDDTFLDRIPWDLKEIPKENFPLLLHYHPMVIYRHMVCKQADLILAMYLLGNYFTLEEKKKHFEFYDKVTTHDSSLSMAVFGIIASEFRDKEKAYECFGGSARLDLDDNHNNVKDGLHMANMAGTWMSIVNGFAGMRSYEGRLSFNPYLPDGWNRYAFKISFKGRVIGVEVNGEGTKYHLLEGEAVTILHMDEELLVK